MQWLYRVPYRKQSLDVLRGIAVLMVLFCHYSPALSFGGYGVDLFFVLSGFLISGLLFEEFKSTGTIRVARFWIRRGFKIYPPYYTFLLLTSLALWFITGSVPRTILADIFFIQNYHPHLWMHGWSLAVEEHFYLALPLLFLLMLAVGRRGPKSFRLVPLVSIALSIFCVYMRVRAARHATLWDQVFAPTHLRLDSLFAGVTLGYYAHFEPESFAEARKASVLALGLLLLIPALLLPSTVMGVTLAYVGFTCVVAWAATCSDSRNRGLRFLAWIGFYSYSIYLWHGAMQVFFDVELRSIPDVVRFPALIASTIITGVAMSRLVELPSLRLRNRLFPSLSRGSPQQPGRLPERVGPTAVALLPVESMAVRD